MHVAAFSDMLCQDERHQNSWKEENTQKMFPHLCEARTIFGKYIKTYLITVDRNVLFNYFMGHSLLLYYNKGLLCYESTENRKIKPGLQDLGWIVVEYGIGYGSQTLKDKRVCTGRFILEEQAYQAQSPRFRQRGHHISPLSPLRS